MSFKATLANNQIETKTFHNIDNIYDIIALETGDVAPLKIDFTTGEISINNTVQTRIGQFFSAYAKPIQYTKATQFINATLAATALQQVYDIEEVEVKHTFCQTVIGYEYVVNNIKTKIELESDTEIQAITAMVTTTDLTTEEKYPTQYMRLY